MHLENKEIVYQPVDIVYRLMRDDLVKLAPFIGNIEKIERVKYERVGDNQVEIINNWHGFIDIPRLFKPIAKPEYLHLKDISTWRDDAKRADYHVQHLSGQTMFDLKGSFIFTPAAGDQTRLTIEGELAVYYDRIPGVPRLLAKSVKNYLDKFIEQQVPPNMSRLARAINAYFKSQGK